MDVWGGQFWHARTMLVTRLGQGPFCGPGSKWHSRVCIHLGKLSTPRRVVSSLWHAGNSPRLICEGTSLEDNTWETAQAKAKQGGVVKTKVLQDHRLMFVPCLLHSLPWMCHRTSKQKVPPSEQHLFRQSRNKHRERLFLFLFLPERPMYFFLFFQLWLPAGWAISGWRWPSTWEICNISHSGWKVVSKEGWI